MLTGFYLETLILPVLVQLSPTVSTTEYCPVIVLPVSVPVNVPDKLLTAVNEFVRAYMITLLADIKVLEKSPEEFPRIINEMANFQLYKVKCMLDKATPPKEDGADNEPTS